MPTKINQNRDVAKPGKAEGAQLLQLDYFALPGLSHGFTTRHGGVSNGSFTSLNTSFGVGDEEESVRQNRLRIKQALGFKTMVSSRQIHGNKVLVLDNEPVADFEADGYDALVTNQHVGLMIQQADCQAVILHDPVRQVVGAAHAGWRGSVEGIIGATVKAMTDNFATNPANLKVAISPSLGPCCAEFINYRRELPEWMHSFQTQPDYFDFWAISRTQLHEAGVKPININMARICTHCSADHFSYRRSQITGRCASVIGLVAS